MLEPITAATNWDKNIPVLFTVGVDNSVPLINYETSYSCRFVFARDDIGDKVKKYLPEEEAQLVADLLNQSSQQISLTLSAPLQFEVIDAGNKKAVIKSNPVDMIYGDAVKLSWEINKLKLCVPTR